MDECTENILNAFLAPAPQQSQKLLYKLSKLRNSSLLNERFEFEILDTFIESINTSKLSYIKINKH
jgi:hypothetical protein